MHMFYSFTQISNVITKKQTIINMEKDMDIWLKVQFISTCTMLFKTTPMTCE